MKKLLNKFFGKEIKIKSIQDIENSKHFCMIPWIHLHALPNSRVIPCCVSEFDYSYGDLKKNSILDIWNNSKFKAMRRLMLSDRPVYSCNKCYELEESNINSMRTRINNEFKNHIHLLENTNNDGFQKNPKMLYLDFRFSNICNFKCRGCSPALSTKWYEDHQKLWDFKSDEPKLINMTKDNPNLWPELKTLLPSVEKAYFAGGEPLLMDEHYECLEFLIENDKTDVTLSYNTNLSILKFKKYDLVSMWKKFKKVDLMISIDDIESRGEYFRSGLDWEKLLENVAIVKKDLPHIYIHINCTISLFNIHRIPEIHSALLNNKIVTEYGFLFNTLQDPIEYRTQVLSPKLKKETVEKLQNYIILLEKRFPDQDWESFKSGIQTQIDFMNAEDLEYKKDEFKKITQRLDTIRKESFEKTYPELAELVK